MVLYKEVPTGTSRSNDLLICSQSLEQSFGMIRTFVEIVRVL